MRMVKSWWTTSFSNNITVSRLTWLLRMQPTIPFHRFISSLIDTVEDAISGTTVARFVQCCQVVCTPFTPRSLSWAWGRTCWRRRRLSPRGCWSEADPAILDLLGSLFKDLNLRTLVQLVVQCITVEMYVFKHHLTWTVQRRETSPCRSWKVEPARMSRYSDRSETRDQSCEGFASRSL